MNFDDIKLRAKEMMSPQMGNLILVFLIYNFIFAVITSISMGFAWVLLFGPLGVGVASVLLKLDRGDRISVEELFSGFNDFGKNLQVGVLIALYTFLWAILLIIPGIVAMLSYSMSFFILQENPELSAEAAISASKKLMLGHKWELFALVMSFLWWWILCIITFGLALIYVMPYFSCALTIYYQNLKHGQKLV